MSTELNKAVPDKVTVATLFDHPMLEGIHQWLADAMGAHPDRLVLTDPAQNFRPVIDIEPLMLILGGPWAAAVLRCHEAKRNMADKRKATRAVHAGEAEEGSFGSVNGQKWRAVPILDSRATVMERPDPNAEKPK